jgi:1-acyl-sn-glycerol-3-phosphate acyltransferase
MPDFRPDMSLSQRLARLALRLIGWTCVDLPQRPDRAVVIGYPHTSNWDFPIGLLTMIALGLNARWAGKDSLFRGPFGPLMRWLGGIPVNRRERTGFVDRFAAELRQQKRFMLVMAPEGTRSLMPGWKSGFYRIARAADVPVLVAVLDYAHRKAGLLASITLSGDEAADLAAIAACYRDCKGCRPEMASPIRLQ